MFKSRLKATVEKWSKVDFKCGYAKQCEHFKEESETCMNALDKNYCGSFKGFSKRDNT